LRSATRRRLARSTAAGGLLLALVYLVIIPLLAITFGSLRTAPLGTPSPVTLEHYRVLLGSPTLPLALRNTLVFATGSTMVSVALGGYLAFVTERSGARLRVVFYVLVVASLIVPGILTTAAWVLLLHGRIGVLNGLLQAWGLPAMFDAYTLAAMIWVDGSDGIVLPFLFIAAALRAQPPELEQAARLSGANGVRLFTTVTLPLLVPAIFASALLAFIRSVGSFAVPAAMGIPGGIRLLASEVYLASRLFPADANLAAAYALIYLLIAAVALLLFRAATRGQGRFVTVGGRGSTNRSTVATRSRIVHETLGAIIVLIIVVLPLLIVLHTSLQPFYRPPFSAGTSTASLDNYRWALSNSIVRRAFRNNLLIGGLAAAAGTVLAATIAWASARRPGRTTRAMDALATIPIAVPGTVFAVALLWWYLYLPLPLYATRWVIGFGLITTFLPFGVRSIHAALLQVDPSLEEASEVAGARWMTTFHRIVLPIVLPSVLAAMIYMLSRSFKALALPALLSGPGGEMIPTVIYSLYSNGRYPELNALGVLLTLVLSALAGLATVAQRRSATGSER
jgi:iron(III) transport system permease protein